MTINIDNIGIINTAKIELNGITVIAGENDSGKSTVARVLYNLFSLDNTSCIEKRLAEEFRDIKNLSLDIYEYENKIISFKDGAMDVFLKDRIPFNTALYFENPHILDELDFHIKTGHVFSGMPKKLDLLNNLKKEAYNVSENIESLQNRLKEIVKGEFKYNAGGLEYIYEDKTFNVCHMAAGLKTYSILKILVDNNTINSKTLLIFDEPEIHLHPKWQVDLAELLIIIRKQLSPYLLINTHSPYFLRALQLFSKENDIITKYYFSKRVAAFSSEIKDVTDDLGDVYATLSRPFEDLWELGDIYD